MSTSDAKSKGRKQTLLQKYDMIVEYLSFEHIDKCDNIRELEKILKILRSGEEGHYPHLEKAAEEKLRKYSPNNHLLRVETPVIRTSALAHQDRELVSNDMQKWAEDMSSRDNLLRSQEISTSITEDTPAIRNSSVSKSVIEKNRMNKSSSPQPKTKSSQKCTPNDYTFWDKFDADGEVLKMDLEEERLAEKKLIERKQQEEIQRSKDKIKMEEEEAVRDRLRNMRNTAGSGDDLAFSEREFNSLQEKAKGNEYFRDRELMKALEHYTRSISFLPNVDAFNNRAQTYLKLNDHSSAMEDCKSVLSMDPKNVKAYYRRGCALFSLEKYQDALDDFEKALEMNPNDKDIQEYVKKARLKLGIPVSSKRVRMAIQSKTPSLVEETGSDCDNMYYPFFNVNPNEDIALNAIGTAKVMCRCNGTPGFMKKVRSLEDIKDHGQICLRRNTRPLKKNPSLTSEVNQKPEGQAALTNGKSVISEDNLTTDVNLVQKDVNTNSISSLKTAPNMQEALGVLEKLKTPDSFSLFWSAVKDVEDLPTIAKALRVLNPKIIVKVIGNQLKGKMLTLFIMALRAHFSLPSEWSTVQCYLLSFSRLPTFTHVTSMLDKRAKQDLELLLNDAERLGLRVSDLLQLYGLTGP